MLKIDDNLLQEIGLGSLPAEEKRGLLTHIYETLEMRVGMRLADQMTNEQLDEFERYFEAKDDAGAFKWLETNFPNYKEIVNEEFEKLKAEVAGTANQILAASQQNMAAHPLQPQIPQQPGAPTAGYAQPAPAPQPYTQPQPVYQQPPVQQPYQQPQPQQQPIAPQNPQTWQQPYAAPQPQPQYGQPAGGPAPAQPPVPPQPYQAPQPGAATAPAYPPQQPPAGPGQQDQPAA